MGADCQICQRIRRLGSFILGLIAFLAFGPRYAAALGIELTTLFAGLLLAACLVVFLVKLKRESSAAPESANAQLLQTPVSGSKAGR